MTISVRVRERAPLRSPRGTESGVSLPAGTRFLTLVSSPLPANIEVGMVLERADGTWHESLASPDETQDPLDDGVQPVRPRRSTAGVPHR